MSNNNIGKQILAGTTAVISTPFGIAGTALEGTYNIVNNTITPVVEGATTGNITKVLSAPINTITSTVDTVVKTTESIVVTPANVYKSVSSGQFENPITVSDIVVNTTNTINNLPDQINNAVNNTMDRVNDTVKETTKSVSSILTKVAIGAALFVVAIAVIAIVF